MQFFGSKTVKKPVEAIFGNVAAFVGIDLLNVVDVDLCAKSIADLCCSYHVAEFDEFAVEIVDFGLDYFGVRDVVAVNRKKLILAHKIQKPSFN